MTLGFDAFEEHTKKAKFDDLNRTVQTTTLLRWRVTTYVQKLALRALEPVSAQRQH